MKKTFTTFLNQRKGKKRPKDGAATGGERRGTAVPLPVGGVGHGTRTGFLCRHGLPPTLLAAREVRRKRTVPFFKGGARITTSTKGTGRGQAEGVWVRPL